MLQDTLAVGVHGAEHEATEHVHELVVKLGQSAATSDVFGR
jgi:hypothetical protein